MKVFISYTNKDKKFADRLSSDLIKKNIYIWKDDYEIQRGDNLTPEILNGIKKSTNMIIIFSIDYICKISQNDSYCKTEFEKALEMQQKDDNFIIPIVLEDCKIPNVLKDKLFVDFRNSYDDGMMQLNDILFKYLKSGSRFENNKYIIDYAKYWGIERLEGYEGFLERFVLNIDSVSIEVDRSYSILTQFKIVGGKQFTNIFRKFLEEKKDYILVGTIIDRLYEELEVSTKKSCIRLDTDGFKETRSKIYIGEYDLQYRVYINRLGDVPNRIGEFNYGSIIEAVYNGLHHNDS